MSDWSQPKGLTAAEVAFPTNVCGKYLPPMDEIPEPFHSYGHPTARIVERLFFNGGSIAAWKEKPGVDRDKAIRQLRVVLGSFEPKHEHKIAGAAYLVDLWFDVPSEGASR